MDKRLKCLGKVGIVNIVAKLYKIAIVFTLLGSVLCSQVCNVKAKSVIVEDELFNDANLKYLSNKYDIGINQSIFKTMSTIENEITDDELRLSYLKDCVDKLCSDQLLKVDEWMISGLDGGYGYKEQQLKDATTYFIHNLMTNTNEDDDFYPMIKDSIDKAYSYYKPVYDVIDKLVEDNNLLAEDLEQELRNDADFCGLFNVYSGEWQGSIYEGLSSEKEMDNFFSTFYAKKPDELDEIKDLEPYLYKLLDAYFISFVYYDTISTIMEYCPNTLLYQGLSQYVKDNQLYTLANYILQEDLLKDVFDIFSKTLKERNNDTTIHPELLIVKVVFDSTIKCIEVKYKVSLPGIDDYIKASYLLSFAYTLDGACTRIITNMVGNDSRTELIEDYKTLWDAKRSTLIASMNCYKKLTSKDLYIKGLDNWIQFLQNDYTFEKYISICLACANNERAEDLLANSSIEWRVDSDKMVRLGSPIPKIYYLEEQQDAFPLMTTNGTIIGKVIVDGGICMIGNDITIPHIIVNSTGSQINVFGTNYNLINMTVNGTLADLGSALEISHQLDVTNGTIVCEDRPCSIYTQNAVLTNGNLKNVNLTTTDTLEINNTSESSCVEDCYLKSDKKIVLSGNVKETIIDSPAIYGGGKLTDVEMNTDKYYCNQIANFYGENVIDGKVVVTESGFNVNSATITVKDDFRIQSENEDGEYGQTMGYLSMTDSDGHLLVLGDFYAQGREASRTAFGTSMVYSLKYGVLELKGDFYQYNFNATDTFNYSSVDEQKALTFVADVNHRVVLSGSGKQKIYFEYYETCGDVSDYWGFGKLITDNRNVEIISGIRLKDIPDDLYFEGDVDYIRINSGIIGWGENRRISISGSLNKVLSYHKNDGDQWPKGFCFDVKGDLNICGELTDGEIVTEGNLNYTGTTYLTNSIVEVGGNCKSDGTLKLCNSEMTIGGDWTIGDKGITIQSDAESLITVEKNLKFQQSKYLTKIYNYGLWKVSGDINDPMYNAITGLLELDGEIQTITGIGSFENLRLSNDETIFNTSFTCKGYFDHQRRPFILNRECTFIDYDGDGLKDNIDSYPLIANVSVQESDYYVSGEKCGDWYCTEVEILPKGDYFEISDDNGRTWKRSLLIEENGADLSVIFLMRTKDAQKITKSVTVSLNIDTDVPTIDIKNPGRFETSFIDIKTGASGISKVTVQRDNDEISDITLTYGNGYKFERNGLYVFSVLSNSGKKVVHSCRIYGGSDTSIKSIKVNGIDIGEIADGVYEYCVIYNEENEPDIQVVANDIDAKVLITNIDRWEKEPICITVISGNQEVQKQYILRLSKPQCTHEATHNVIVKECTCVEDGWNDIVCDYCETIVGHFLTPKMNHLFGDWILAEEATEEKEGEMIRNCERCGEEENVKIPQLCEHTHTFTGKEEIITEATCEVSGKKKVYCSEDNCFEYIELTINVTEHLWESNRTIDVEPSCVQVGQSSIHCQNCEQIDDVVILPTNLHQYGDWTIQKTPTYTEEGIETRECKICHAEEKMRIPVLQEVHPISISFEKNSYIVEKLGTIEEISVVFVPGTTSNKNYQLTSDDMSVIQIVNNQCVAMKEGTANITAISEDGELITECYITVIAGEEKEADQTTGGEDTSLSAGDSHTHKTNEKNATSNTILNIPDETVGKEVAKPEEAQAEENVEATENVSKQDLGVSINTDYSNQIKNGDLVDDNLPWKPLNNVDNLTMVEKLILSQVENQPLSEIEVDLDTESVISKYILQKVMESEKTIVLKQGKAKWIIVGSEKGDIVNNIDFGITEFPDMDLIPKACVDKYINDSKILEIELSHNGEFGFEPILIYELGKENAGKFANMFYYDELKNEIRIVNSCVITSDGNAKFKMSHASKYAIVICDKDLNVDESESKEINIYMVFLCLCFGVGFCIITRNVLNNIPDKKRR
ncbi:MAG: hypothetical protein ACI4FV_03930 [Lachnospiraceae bacterium]